MVVRHLSRKRPPAANTGSPSGVNVIRRHHLRSCHDGLPSIVFTFRSASQKSFFDESSPSLPSWVISMSFNDKAMYL